MRFLRYFFIALILCLNTNFTLAGICVGEIKNPDSNSVGENKQFILDRENYALRSTEVPQDRWTYMQCGSTSDSNDNHLACNYNAYTLGWNGHIYQCTIGNKWVKIDDKKWNDCTDTYIAKYGNSTSNSEPIVENNQALEFIFLFDSVQWDQVKNICKIKKEKYYKLKEECIAQGGAFANDDKVCDFTHKETLTINVVDESNTPISGVSFIYADFHSEEYKEYNVATPLPNGSYSISVNKEDNPVQYLLVSADGYDQFEQDVSNPNFTNNFKIFLKKQASTPQTPTPPSFDEDTCKKSGGTPDSNNQTCTCEPNKGLKQADDNKGVCVCNADGWEYDQDLDGCFDRFSIDPKTPPIPISGAETRCVETGGEYNNGYCICTGEVVPDINGCKCIGAPNAKYDKDQRKCISNNALQDAQDRLAAAQDKFNQAKENEQSDANRALTSLSTAAAGLGTMAALSAYSEQQADKKAEADMRQYLGTFQCEYGKGNMVNAGTDEITIPGGNELSKYYAEYKSLADNLKTTKTALGLRAGIESETLYDAAQTGLYHHIAAERQTGAYASLARALSDKESEDAAMWAEQKDASKTKLTAGIVAAGVGVVGGIIGNQIINGGNKDKFDNMTPEEKRRVQCRVLCQYAPSNIPTTLECNCND